MKIKKRNHCKVVENSNNKFIVRTYFSGYKTQTTLSRLKTVVLLCSTICSSQSLYAQNCDWGTTSGQTNIFTCQSGTLNSDARGTDNNDQFQINGGRVAGELFGGEGDDEFILRQGQVNAISGDAGNDYIELHGGFNTELSNFKINGGQDYDNLTLKNFNGTLNADNLLNLETISIQDSSILKLSGYQLQFAHSTDWGKFLVISQNSEVQFNSNFFSILNGNINNSGTINLRGSELGKTLFLNGNYVGEPGSKILFNTKLGSDQSPTDYFVITGYSIGQSKVFVQNIGGAGAKTNEGIRIIEIHGMSDAKFTLGEPLQVANYEYFLTQKGKDWYLESSSNGYVNCVGCEPQANTIDSKSIYLNSNYSSAKIFRPAIAGYLQAADAISENNTQFLSQVSRRQNNTNKTPEMWGTFQSNQAHLKNTIFSYKQKGQIIQLGQDIGYIGSQSIPENKSAKYGITIGAGQLSTEYFDQTRTHTAKGDFSGVSQTNNLALGAYYRNEKTNEPYIELQTQIIRSSSQFKDIYDGYAKQNGLGVVVSAEVGKTLSVSSNPFEITPQAQIIYQQSKYSSFKDEYSVIEKQSAESLRVRAGISVKSNLFQISDNTNKHSNDSNSSNSYWNTSLNLWQEVLNMPNRTISGTVIETSNSKKPWLELALGFYKQVNEASNLSAQITLKRSLDGNQKNGHDLHLGYEYKW